MTQALNSEAALVRAAAATAHAWRDAAVVPLAVGLQGELGAGKTTWVRALLRALGYQGRVPSPTYTLVEHYDVAGLAVVHVDLYRLQSAEELETLGLRDWLALPNHWLLVEWPARAAGRADLFDVVLDIRIGAGEARVLDFEARTAQGARALAALAEASSS